MCFIVKFSKYISVPVLTEWLNRVDLLLFDASILNRSDHDWLLSLMTEYSSIVYDKLLQSVHESELSLLELCGWYRRFGLPVEVLCRVRISMFDFTLISKYNWMRSCEEVLNRAVNVNVELGMYDDSFPGDLLSCLMKIRSLIADSSGVLKYFGHCTVLTSVVISYNFCDDDDFSFAVMCRMCPQLETIELHDYLYDTMVSHAITMHCKNLKKLKCYAGDMRARRNAFIFAFHSVSNNLTDIDWEVYDDKDSLVLRTRLWYKGSKLTHLILNDDQLRKHSNLISVVDVISIACPCVSKFSLEFVNKVDNKFYSFVNTFGHSLSYVDFCVSKGLGVVAACMKCPALQTLHMYRRVTLSNSDLLTIVQSCPLLVNLLLECHGLTDGCISLIAPYIGNVAVLSLISDSYIDFTVEDCAAIAHNMKKLHTLKIKYNTLHYSVFCSLLKISSLTSLKLQSYEVFDFGDQLPNICSTSLTALYVNIRMNDANFVALLSCCPNLTSLQTHFTDTRLTVEFLRSISTCCKKLRIVNIKSELGQMTLLDIFPRFVSYY